MLSPSLVRHVLPLGLCLCFGPAVAAPAAPVPVDLTGYYAVPDYSIVLTPHQGPFILSVHSCDTGFCGRIAARGPLPDKDLANPVSADRGRALCDLQILSVAMAPAKTQASRPSFSGSFYDPRNGDNDTVMMFVDAKGELHVMGHSGRPVLSRTYVRREEVWQRVAPPQAACDQTQPAT